MARVASGERAAGRALLAAGVLCVAALAVLAVVGPGARQAPPAGRETPAARHAGVAAAQAAVDAACGAPVAGGGAPARRAAATPSRSSGGGTATVALRRSASPAAGPRAEVVGTAPCPAG